MFSISLFKPLPGTPWYREQHPVETRTPGAERRVGRVTVEHLRALSDILLVMKDGGRRWFPSIPLSLAGAGRYEQEPSPRRFPSSGAIMAFQSATSQ